MDDKQLRKGKFSGVNFQKFGWWEDTDLLRNFFNTWSKTGRLEYTYVDFESHFTNSLPIPKDRIVYKGTGTELMNIFIDLVESGLIPDTRNLHCLICDHFCKPGGLDFNPNSMKTMKGRGKSLKVKIFTESLTAKSRQIGLK